MQINGKIVVLAREIRGMTQQYLASRMSMSLYALSRVERGVLEELSEEQVLTIAGVLDFPVDFFRQDAPQAGPAPCCPAGRNALDETAQKRVRGVASLLRVNIARLLATVKVVPRHELPTLVQGSSGPDPEGVAATLRSLWRVGEGPLGNLAALVEAAGVVIVRGDFGSALASASLRSADTPPLVLVDQSIPVDHDRMALAHQLGHLVMHQGTTSVTAEMEADGFAKELLLPRRQMQSAFQSRSRIAPEDLEDMRTRWLVPTATLLERAHSLGLVDTITRNRLWTSARIRSWPVEPRPALREEATTLRDMLDCFMREHRLGPEEVARQFRIGMRDMASWYGSSIPRAGAARTPESAGSVVHPLARRRRAATIERA